MRCSDSTDQEVGVIVVDIAARGRRLDCGGQWFVVELWFVEEGRADAKGELRTLALFNSCANPSLHAGTDGLKNIHASHNGSCGLAHLGPRAAPFFQPVDRIGRHGLPPRPLGVLQYLGMASDWSVESNKTPKRQRLCGFYCPMTLMEGQGGTRGGCAGMLKYSEYSHTYAALLLAGDTPT